jgi:uncharacterized integral membrane protein
MATRLPLLFTLLTLLTLAACAPVPADPAHIPPGGNPVLDAQATLAQAQAVLATQQAAEYQAAARATERYMSTEQAAQAEIDLLFARQTVSEADYQRQLSISRATEAYEAKVTAQARADLEATQAAGLATEQYKPTATHVALLATQAAQNETVAHYTGLAWRVIWPAGMALLFIAGVGALLGVAWSSRGALARYLETRELRNRVIESPSLGRLVIERLPDGRLLAYDPARLPGPAGIIGSGGVTVAGLGADPALLGQVLARAQAVDLARAMPRKPAQQVIEAPAHPAHQVGGAQPVIRIVDGQAGPVAGWLAEIEDKFFLEG